MYGAYFTHVWWNLMVNVDPMGHAYMSVIGKQISMWPYSKPQVMSITMKS